VKIEKQPKPKLLVVGCVWTLLSVDPGLRLDRKKREAWGRDGGWNLEMGIAIGEERQGFEGRLIELGRMSHELDGGSKTRRRFEGRWD